ncbi:hypothetical protein GCM10022627_22340 [Haloarcula argentinensis]
MQPEGCVWQIGGGQYTPRPLRSTKRLPAAPYHDACMPSYEYKALDVDTGMFGGSSVPVDELNALGADGWEVVAPITENSGQTAGLLLQRER